MQVITRAVTFVGCDELRMFLVINAWCKLVKDLSDYSFGDRGTPDFRKGTFQSKHCDGVFCLTGAGLNKTLQFPLVDGRASWRGNHVIEGVTYFRCCLFVISSLFAGQNDLQHSVDSFVSLCCVGRGDWLTKERLDQIAHDEGEVGGVCRQASNLKSVLPTTLNTRSGSLFSAFVRGCVQGMCVWTGGMKLVDMETVHVVHSGEAWPFTQPPCSRQMIRHLEKNEGLVTWVQVRDVPFVLNHALNK